MRIALVISSLRTGGAERSAVNLCKGLLRAGHKVAVLTWSSPETDFFHLPDGAQRIALDMFRPSQSAIEALGANLRRLSALRAALRDFAPDAVISFMTATNVQTVLALAGSGVPVVITDHHNPGHETLGRAWKALRRAVYPRAARLVLVSRGMQEHYAWLPAGKRAVIANPVEIGAGGPQEESLPAGFPPPDCTTVVGLGRLAPDKGFDLLLRAFALTSERAPGWKLVILGEGAERPRLEALARELGLDGAVTLPGAIATPQLYLRASGLLAVSSRTESFGIGIVEAFACGLPVVSFDCPNGPRELITHGSDGLLVPPGDVGALAEALLRVMTDARLRAALAENTHRAAQRYTVEHVVAAWEQLFADMGLHPHGRAVEGRDA